MVAGVTVRFFLQFIISPGWKNLRRLYPPPVSLIPPHRVFHALNGVEWLYLATSKSRYTDKIYQRSRARTGSINDQVNFSNKKLVRQQAWKTVILYNLRQSFPSEYDFKESCVPGHWKGGPYTSWLSWLYRWWTGRDKTHSKVWMIIVIQVFTIGKECQRMCGLIIIIVRSCEVCQKVNDQTNQNWYDWYYNQYRMLK